MLLCPDHNSAVNAENRARDKAGFVRGQKEVGESDFQILLSWIIMPDFPGLPLTLQ
jgi:hypothetical protein